MSELQEAIQEMRNMRESYDQIGAAAEAYNTGKTELAANITAKGVPASASETLPELAEKVSDIAQESYTIQGGELYGAQISGSLQTPNYWDLYAVLTQLLSDGRLTSYGGILLAEYYRGYDSLALAGAGAGGAYVVSDKDEQGNFIMYTDDAIHTWATKFDGKGNRWVAYCFANEEHDFEISDTNTSPRSIHIGRSVGVIRLLANSRTSEIVVRNGSSLKDINLGSYDMGFGRSVVLKNMKLANSGLRFSTSLTESVYIEYETIDILNTPNPPQSVALGLVSIIIKAKKITNSLRLLFGYNNDTMPNLATVIVDGVEECGSGAFVDFNNNGVISNASRFNEILFTNTEELRLRWNVANLVSTPLHRIYIGYKINDKSKGFYLSLVSSSAGLTRIDDIELKDGWCKPLSVMYNSSTGFTGLTEANMYSHILQRLKQDEAGCGSGVTITLGTTNLNKLTSAESVELLQSLRSTYGYTIQ